MDFCNVLSQILSGCSYFMHLLWFENELITWRLTRLGCRSTFSCRYIWCVHDLSASHYSWRRYSWLKFPQCLAIGCYCHCGNDFIINRLVVRRHLSINRVWLGPALCQNTAVACLTLHGISTKARALFCSGSNYLSSCLSPIQIFYILLIYYTHCLQLLFYPSIRETELDLRY